MAESLGKKWETVFKTDWSKSFKDSFIYRLPDQIGGFAGIGGSNPCDFICFAAETLFLVECKTHLGASLPFSCVSQFDRLLKYKNITGVYPGVLLWLSEKDLVIWCPITTLEQMRQDGWKSIGLKTISDKKYRLLVLPAIKKRIFMEADYTQLINFTKEGT